MTKEQFEQTAYNGKITYETYQQCDCTECKRECIHREAYRRMPEEVGGLGLCPNLKAKYKLRVYELAGINKGNLDHEEYFETKEEMDERYSDLFEYELYNLNPTAWELVDGEWTRIRGY